VEEKEEPVTPRRAPKRQARKEVKYEESDVPAEEFDEDVDESESEYDEDKDDEKMKIEEGGDETGAAAEATKPERKEIKVEAPPDTDIVGGEVVEEKVVEEKVVEKEIRLSSPFKGKSVLDLSVVV
jgi:hypothetical protein